MPACWRTCPRPDAALLFIVRKSGTQPLQISRLSAGARVQYCRKDRTRHSREFVMITVRPAAERGADNLSWLDSRHTFSFGHYYDAKHMGFGPLRVINEDRVRPGAGF